MDHPSGFSLKLSAPGKVILFGEYSVVFQKPAVASTLSLRTNLHLYNTNSDAIDINFSTLDLRKRFLLKDIKDHFQIPSTDSWASYLQSLTNAFECFYTKTQGSFDLTDPQKFSLIAFFHCFAKLLSSSKGFCLKIDSELPIGSGVGSSASFSVVLSAAALLYEHFQSPVLKSNGFMEKKQNETISILESFKNQISEKAFSCETIFHGSPSGIDHNTVLNGSMIEFIKSNDGKNKITPISTSSLKILLVNTNIPRSTKTIVASVKQLREKHPEIMEYVLNGMATIAKNAVKDLQRFEENHNNTNEVDTHFGELVSLNHSLLRVLGTSHPALELIVSTAQKFGLHAKLTGAGGGGFGFIYIPSSVQTSVIKSIEKELTGSGFTVYDVSLGVPGLTVEELKV